MKAIGILLVVLLALVAAVGPFLPTHATVGRRLTIHAPPEALWPDVAALSTWPEWTDWSVANDPAYDPKPEGPALGVGAKLTWTKSQGGGGMQRITEADIAKGIRYVIDVEGGAVGIEGRVLFARRVDNPEVTDVTWLDAVHFRRSYLGRYFVPMMDAALGPKIEKSLFALKRRAEERVKAGGLPVAAGLTPAELKAEEAAHEPSDAPKPEATTPPDPLNPEEPKPPEPRPEEPKPEVQKPPEPKPPEPKPEEPKPEVQKPPEPKPEEPKPEPKPEEPKPEAAPETPPGQ